MDEKDVRTCIVEAWIKNGLLDKSYSHKPHLASLPYDRRSRNFDELKERYEACSRNEDLKLKEMRELQDVISNEMEDYDKHKKDLDESVDKLKQWNEDNQKFFDADDKVFKEKRRIMDDMMDRINYTKEDIQMDESLLKRIQGLEQYYFTDNYPTGFLNKAEQKEFNDLADDIMKFANEQTGGGVDKGNQWLNRVRGISDTIRDLASNDNIDKNLPSLEKNVHSVGEMSGLQDHINIVQNSASVLDESIKNHQKEFDKTKRLWNDYRDEGGRVSNLCYDLGFI